MLIFLYLKDQADSAKSFKKTPLEIRSYQIHRAEFKTDTVELIRPTRLLFDLDGGL